MPPFLLEVESKEPTTILNISTPVDGRDESTEPNWLLIAFCTTLP
jgi:hypothetical protein